MGTQYLRQICENGHEMTDMYEQGDPSNEREYCSRCGSKGFVKCKDCGEEIKGVHMSSMGPSSPGDIPEYCGECGESFPWISSVNEGGELELERPIDKIDHLCRRFPYIARQLEERHNDRTTIEMTDEYDVQDLLKPLLFLYFDDVRSEEYSPSYAGVSPRIDFLLKENSIAIEVKTTLKKDKREMKEELAVDKDHYRSHSDCELLVCFIYDPGVEIDNSRGFEHDVGESTENLRTKAIIAPQGE